MAQFRVAINDTRGAHFFDVVSWDPAEWEPDTLTTGAKLVLAGRLPSASDHATGGAITMTAHEDLIQDVIAGVERVGQEFTRPDEDWWPVLLGQDITGKRITVDVRPAYVDEQSKEAFSASLPFFIVEAKLHRVAWVASSWIVELEADEQAQVRHSGWPRPSQHPRRKEVVVVYACSDEMESLSVAEILRDGVRPPRLAAWQQNVAQGVGATCIEGRFAEPIRLGVEAVLRSVR